MSPEETTGRSSQTDGMAPLSCKVSSAIPLEFRRARRRFAFYAYRNRFWDQLALSLTLGGVLYSVTDRPFFAQVHATVLGTNIPAVSLLLVLASLLAVPGLAVWQLDRDRLRGILQRWTRRTPAERVLFYFLFYVRRLLQEIRDLDALLFGVSHPERVRTTQPEESRWSMIERLVERMGQPYPDRKVKRGVRRIRASLSHLEFLADLLSTPLEAPPGSFLVVDHCRIRTNGLLRTIDAYRTAVQEVIHRLDSSHPAREAARATIDSCRAALERQMSEVKRVTEPAIARPALRITTQAGTNNMMLSLSGALSDIWSKTKIDARTRLKSADALLEAVDTTRTGGWLIRDMLDLPQSLTDSPGALSHKVLDNHSRGRVRATNEVAVNVTAVINSRRSGDKPTAVATIGYSSTVLACLRHARASVGPVFVLQCDAQTIEADELMLAALEDMDIEAAVVSLREGGPVDPRLKDIKVALFGFEAVSPTGELAHRHGLQAVLRPIETFLEALGRQSTAVTVCAVGESWKVREFDERRTTDRKKKVPSRLIYNPQRAFWIVTDCRGDGGHRYHKPTGTDQEGPFRLSCCQSKWTTLRSNPDQPPVDF